VRRAGPVVALILGALCVLLLTRGPALDRAPVAGPTLGPVESSSEVLLEPTDALGSAPIGPHRTRAAGLPVGPLGPLAGADPGQGLYEGPISLRPARGLVRDARTRAPIEGAWLTWRPPPAEALELVFDHAGFRGLAGRSFGMLSGPDGRFVIDRLPDDMPPEPYLFAVARGYALSAVKAGLDDLVIELEPAGKLRVVIAGARPAAWQRPRLSWRADEAGPYQREVLDKRVPEQSGSAFEFGHLRPGAYRVRLGQSVADVEVELGRLAEVLLPAPESIRIAGVMRGYDPRVPAWLELARADGAWGRDLNLEDDGTFSVLVLPGDYLVRWIDSRAGSEQTLARVAETTTSLDLSPRAGQVLEFVVEREGVPWSSAVGVAEARPGGDRYSATLTSDDRQRVEGARPGLYRVFSEGAYLGEVELTPGQAPRLVAELQEVELLLSLPELRPDEDLRMELRLTPLALDDDPDLQNRLREEAYQELWLMSGGEQVLHLEFSCPGRYRLTVRSDLGHVELELELGEGKTGPFSVDLSQTEAER